MRENNSGACERCQDRLLDAYSKLKRICMEVSESRCGTDYIEDECAMLTRQIRKVRECLTESKR